MTIFKYDENELEYLKKKDEQLGMFIEQIGKLEREVTPDLFSALISSIVSQQISTKAAATVWNRLKERLKEVTPQSVVHTSIEDIQQCGLSTRKATYIKGIADAVINGDIDLKELAHLSDEDVIKRLSALNGIGVWTAEMLLLFSLQRSDIVSYNDLGIRRGMMRLYGLEDLTKDQFNTYKERYSPYGSVASLYLWELGNKK